MATVYLALHEMLDREVAIKIMAPSLGADPSFGERFLREAKIVAQLSHPNIIAVYDVGVSGTHHYIAMEYHEGGELKDKIGSDGMDPKEAVKVISQIASALNFAHEKGYIHRDVKPENILFSNDGNALLMDFGIARAEDSKTQMTQAGSVIGTPTYMSPEQAQGKPLDGRSDLYCLGVVFYEMLTGAPPFVGDSGVAIAVKHMTDPIPELQGPLKKYQPFLNVVLAKNANDRVENGTQFIELLKKVDEGLPVDDQARKTAIWTPDKDDGTQVVDIQKHLNKDKAGGAKWAIAVVVLLSVGAAAYFFSGQSPEANKLASKEPRVTVEPVRIESKAAADPLRIKIQALLDEAQQNLEQEKVISPSNDNAFQKYQAVTFLDDNNKEAKQGLLTISNLFLAKAERSIQQKNLKSANEQVKQAEEIYQANPKISQLNRMLVEAKKTAEKNQQANAENERKSRIAQQQKQAQLAEERRQLEARRKADDLKNATALKNKQQAEASKRKEQEKLRLARLQKEEKARAKKEQQRQAKELKDKINAILSKVDSYLAPGNLSLSRINRAQNLFNDIKRLDANNSAVKKSKSRLAKAYSVLADQMISDKDFNGAEEVLLQGMELAPDNDDLLTVQETLKNRQKKKRRTFGGF